MTTQAVNRMPTVPFLGKDGRPVDVWRQYLLNPAFVSVTLPSSGVAPGNYGSASNVPTYTVSSAGLLTVTGQVAIAITSGQVSGLGTMAIQNAGAVAITGGSATAVTITNSPVSGASVGGTTVTATGAFGCNGKAAQTAAASGGAVSNTGSTQTSPFGYTTAAQADGIVSLLNKIQAALVANGIMT